MTIVYNLETLIANAHTRYEAAKNLTQVYPCRESEIACLKAYDAVDKLIQVYSDPTTPKKECAACGESLFAHYDFTRRLGVRSAVCKTCEGRMYSRTYMHRQRAAKKATEDLFKVGGSPSKRNQADMCRLIDAEFRAASATMRSKLSKNARKIHGYEALIASGSVVNVAAYKRVRLTTERLEAQLGVMNIILKEQYADIAEGKRPKEITLMMRDHKILAEAL